MDSKEKEQIRQAVGLSRAKYGKINVAIVGVGALGSHLVPLLRNEDVRLTVIDFDRVELKNVSSQFHSKGSLRRKKVESIAKLVEFCFGFSILTNPNKLTADNIEQILRGTNLIVDCLDNAEGRLLVQKYAKDNNIPCVHGGLAANGEFGQIRWTEHFTPDVAPEGAATCEDGDFLPFVSLVSSFFALTIQEFLRHGRKIGFLITPSGAKRF